jgi:chorismate mutase
VPTGPASKAVAHEQRLEHVLGYSVVKKRARENEAIDWRFMHHDQMIRVLRDQISANDIALIAGMNRRLELVRELWRYKRAHGVEMLDVEREAWITRYLARANRGPMSDEGLTEFVAKILELTKRELADVMQAPGASS